MENQLASQAEDPERDYVGIIRKVLPLHYIMNCGKFAGLTIGIANAVSTHQNLGAVITGGLIYAVCSSVDSRLSRIDRLDDLDDFADRLFERLAEKQRTTTSD